MQTNRLIGEKIMALRTLKKIEPEDLANKASLSLKQLNLIESGLSIPSLGTLIRITRALGIRIGTLLDETAKEGAAIVRAKEHPSVSSFSTSEDENRENLTFFSLAPNKVSRHMEPFIIDIVSGENKEVQKSSHEGEEFIYVLEGKVTVHYGIDINTISLFELKNISSIVKHMVTTSGTKAKIMAVVYVPV